MARNHHSRWVWAEPPPQGGERSQGSGGNRPLVFKGTGNNNALTLSAWLAQLACRLDREADALIGLGFTAQAERLSHRAAELRGAP